MARVGGRETCHPSWVKPTLRDLIREAEPRDFPVKKAWRRLIQLLRSRRRRTGLHDSLGARALVDQALDRVPHVALDEARLQAGEIKARLRRIIRESLDDDAAESLAGEVDQRVASIVPRTARERVAMAVDWPPGIDDAAQARLLGFATAGLGAVLPGVAAKLVHRLDGQLLAGAPIRVRVALPGGVVLPALSRAARLDGPKAGTRGAPWLPNLDEAGRFSLSPWHMAEAQARWLGGSWVIDPFCGCGGNAIAFALSGAQVIAVDEDRVRLALARSNARAKGVEGRIQFICGDGVRELPRRVEAGTSVFLDPPWGGPGSGAAPSSWEELVPADETFRAALDRADALMLKAPRSFDPASLPGDGWSMRPTFGRASTGDAHVVKALTFRRGPSPGLPGPTSVDSLGG
jgi:hypothetical protein